ncbi:MAG: hypothetical protein ACKOEZ_03855, partial [Spartobacteria bacterium]
RLKFGTPTARRPYQLARVALPRGRVEHGRLDSDTIWRDDLRVVPSFSREAASPHQCQSESIGG